MTGMRKSLETEVAKLTEELQFLRQKMDAMAVRLSALESGHSPDPPEPHSPDIPYQLDEQDMIGWLGQGALLPRISTICFLLVFALILRTITDHNVINTSVGSVIGMGYAIFLIGWGWWAYEKGNRLAPVFPGCGLLLLFSMVFETHVHFLSLPTSAAYFILFAVLVVAVRIALLYRAPFLICLATLGSGITAMAMEYPDPVYPVQAALFAAVNIAAYIAARRAVCPWLQWPILLLTMTFWLFWSFKLSSSPVCDEPIAFELCLSWFFPILFAFWLMYFVTTARSIIKTVEYPSFYDSFIPTIVAPAAFFAAFSAAFTWTRNPGWIVVAALFVVILHFIVAAWFAAREKEGSPGSNIFTVAGAVLLAASLYSLKNGMVWALPIWSITAFVLAIISNRWQSGGVRVTSYLLQGFACIMAVTSGAVATSTKHPAAGILAALTLTVMSLLQYSWCRRNQPPLAKSSYFSWLDKKDVSAAILLLAGLIAGFSFSRLVLFQFLAVTGDDLAKAFSGGQSVLINIGAMLLLVIGGRKKSLEILVTGVVVLLLGAFKVFVLDLFSIKGVPLVVSVLSFGIVAAVGSVVLGRWSRGNEAMGR